MRLYRICPENLLGNYSERFWNQNSYQSELIEESDRSLPQPRLPGPGQRHHDHYARWRSYWWRATPI